MSETDEMQSGAERGVNGAPEPPVGADGFMRELSDLTRKYGIVVWACGCCHGPQLIPIAQKTAEQYRYMLGAAYSKSMMTWAKCTQAEADEWEDRLCNKEPGLGDPPWNDLT